MFQTKVVQKSKHIFYVQFLFFPKIVPFNEEMLKNILQADRLQVTDMAHALCMLGNQGKTHTLRMCNAYRFKAFIIIIILIIIYCNWVVTRWQWLCYMYTKREIGYY